jgi:hypothetical protein
VNQLIRGLFLLISAVILECSYRGYSGINSGYTDKGKKPFRRKDAQKTQREYN